MKLTTGKQYNTLVKNIKTLVEQARQNIVRNVNSTMVLTNFLIGKLIIEHEQQGKIRAQYASETLKQLSVQLTEDLGKGYSVDNLENMRRFYLSYQKSEMASRIFNASSISETPSRKSSGKPVNKGFYLQTIKKNGSPFVLSWSHYVLLSKIKNQNEKSFYEIEATNNNWSVNELFRQYDTALYERLALNRNKKKVKELSQKGQILEKPKDAIKEPYILEFLGLKEDSIYSETDLETAIINKLEQFMLELGKGFLFFGRQVRFTFDEEHFFVDLVFYNRLMKCFLLIDLKIGRLKHQDIGQMQMYVNYYDRFVKTKEENKTIGIIICKNKNDSLVEITLPRNNKQIFASQYNLYLPSKEDLKQLVEEETVLYKTLKS